MSPPIFLARKRCRDEHVRRAGNYEPSAFLSLIHRLKSSEKKLRGHCPMFALDRLYIWKTFSQIRVRVRSQFPKTTKSQFSNCRQCGIDSRSQLMEQTCSPETGRDHIPVNFGLLGVLVQSSDQVSRKPFPRSNADILEFGTIDALHTFSCRVAPARTHMERKSFAAISPCRD